MTSPLLLGGIAVGESAADVDADILAAVVALVGGAGATADTLGELETLLGTKVPKTLFDANTVLAANVDDTPLAVTMGASTILARLAAGNIKAATPAELKTLLAIASGDVSGLGALATLSVVGSAQITDGSVALADQADLAQSTFIGRAAGAGTGVPTALTPAQAAAIIAALTYQPGGTDVAVVDGGTGASTAAAGATNLGLGTGDSPQFTGLNVGHATDTTVTRASAGDIAVEGNAVYRAGGTDVPVADGGTGASTAAAARTNLGVLEVVDESHADVVSGPSSVAENTLASLAIPTTVGVGDVLEFVAFGELVNNSGSTVNNVFRFKIGTTTVLATGNVASATGATVRPWAVTFRVTVVSTTAERVVGIITVPGGAAAAGSFPTATALQLAGHGSAAEDLTVAKNAILTVQGDQNHANTSVTCRASHLIHLRKT